MFPFALQISFNLVYIMLPYRFEHVNHVLFNPNWRLDQDTIFLYIHQNLHMLLCKIFYKRIKHERDSKARI